MDFAGIVTHLRDGGYHGWIVLEDECEASERDPDAATRANGAFVSSVLSALVSATPTE